MKRLPLTLAMAALLVFSSCQKEVDGSMDGADGDKNYMSKVVQTESDYPGEAYVLEFEYDAQKRVTKLHELYLDTVGGVAQVDDEYHYEFHYNGSDAKPARVTSPAQAGWTWYFLYDAQGRKTTDSVVSTTGPDPYVHVASYNYVGNMIYVSLDMDPTATFYRQVYRDTLQYDGNNLSKIILSKREDNFMGYHYETSFQYDDKKNPFHEINIASSFFTSIYPEFPLYFGLSKNNVVNDTEKDLMGPYVGGATRTFSYNANGYPEKVTVSFTWDPSVKQYARFEYLP
jgi:hypothetical protein